MIFNAEVDIKGPVHAKWLELSKESSIPYSEARLYYDDDDKTYNIYNDDSSINLPIGSQIRLKVYNNTGQAIPGGKIVSITGIDGNGFGYIILTNATNDTLRKKIIGLTLSDIPNSSYGWVITKGVLKNVDTSSFAANTLTWLSITEPGGLQNTQPLTTVIKAGIILTSHATTGSMVVDLEAATDISEVLTKWIDFDTTIDAPTWQEGRIFWDKEAKSLAIYDDESETTLQVGQEIRVRVFNNNGVTILNGAAVSVSGVTAEGVVEIGLAIASNKISALNTIGIATHDIEADTYGWATTSGFINNVDTSIYTEGAAIWLSETVPGAYQEIRPLSPSFEVRMGGIAKTHATEGKIYAELRIISDDHDNTKFFNGAILESHRVDIVSNGTTVNCTLISLAANNKLSLIFNQEYVSVADGININLTLGTDIVPIENWVYIDSNGDMQISLSGFPTGVQYVPIIRAVVPSAATAQTYGIYKAHAYTDHLSDSVNQGHLSHLNDWVRKRPASWQEGVVLTQSETEGVPATTINLAYTSGLIAQLHDHTFPIYNTATKPAFIINDPTTPYQIANGLTSAIDEDSAGGSIGNNKYYNLVVWGIISQENKDCKLFFNLPNGSYTNVSDALNDVDTTTNYGIPGSYLGTGFLITKFTIKRTTTNVEVIPGGTKDLRGTVPAIGGGSIIGGGGISKFDELTDTPLTKIGESLKGLRVNAGETSLEYYITPITKTLISGEFITSYNSGTGLFTSAQASYTDLSNIPSDFTPSAHTLDSHLNVTITSIAAGELLKWNGANWINNTLSEAGIQPAGSYDNYVSWNLKTDGTQRIAVVKDGTLDIVGGTNVTAAYSAGGVVTLSSLNDNDIDYISNVSSTLGVLTFTGTGNAFNSTVDLKTYFDTIYDGFGDHTGLYVGLTGNENVAGIKTFTSFSITPTAAPITDYQVANKKYVDDEITGSGGYNDEQAQDAIGSILLDTSEIDFTYDDATPNISAVLKVGSIDVLKLDSGVQTSLGLADTALQSETSHSDVLVDGDFGSNGIMVRTGVGVYSIITDNSSTWDSLTTFPGFDTLFNDYAYTEPTHAFSEITSTPTTIAGYGITDFVSLGDAEWMQIGQQLAITKTLVAGQFFTSYSSSTGLFTSAQASYTDLSNVPSDFTPSAHTLDSHSNVVITTNTTGEIIKWNGTNWINNTLTEAGISATGHTHTFASLTSKPTTISGYGITDLVSLGDAEWMQIGQQLAVTKAAVSGSLLTSYDSSTGLFTLDTLSYDDLDDIPSTFTPSAHTLDSHSNVTITAISTNELLKWSGSAWINNTLAEAGISATGHTHTFASLTSKPTTIGGYGIGDFNSLGDARWLGLTAKAADSELLDGFDSSQFLRSDVSDIKTEGNLSFSDFVQLRFGDGYDGHIISNGNSILLDLFNGNFIIRDGTTTRFTFARTTGNLTATGSITATDFIGNWNGFNSGQFLRSDIAATKTGGSLIFTDGVQLQFGTSTLLSDIKANSGTTRWNLLSGDLKITNSGSDRFTFGRTTGDLTLSNGELTVQGAGVSSFVGSLGVGISNTQALFHVKAADTVEGQIKIEGGKETVSSVGEINSSILFGSNDGSVNGTGEGANQIAGKIASITENTNGAFMGLGFYTFNQTTGDAADRLHEHMRLTYQGRLGIGTDIPQSKVEIADSNPVLRITSTKNGVWTAEEEMAALEFFSSDASGAGIGVQGKISMNSVDTFGDDFDMVFSVDDGAGNLTERFRIFKSGGVTFTNDVTATNFILSSDERLKTNTIDVNKSQRLFINWKTFELKSEPGQKRYGVIAQELEETHPEFVRTDDKGMKSVAYIDLLVAKNAELESRLEDLEAKMALILKNI